MTSLSAKQIESDIGETEPLPSSIINSNIPSLKELQKNSGFVPPQQPSTSDIPAAAAASAGVLKQASAVEVDRGAKLNVISKVKMSIDVDGKQVFSGIHDAGMFDISFKNKAEISIEDASKVNLIYEGINHGPLGYAGRKRKVVLNSMEYTE